MSPGIRRLLLVAGASGLTPPILKSVAIGVVPLTLVFLGTQLPTLQQALLTTSMTPTQWLICLGLAALLPLTVEISKAVRRRNPPTPSIADVERAVSPDRAVKTQHTAPALAGRDRSDV